MESVENLQSLESGKMLVVEEEEEQEEEEDNLPINLNPNHQAIQATTALPQPTVLMSKFSMSKSKS